MDPNATLAIMLDRASDVMDRADDTTDPATAELAEAVINLHTWITRGGFLPRQWGAK